MSFQERGRIRAPTRDRIIGWEVAGALDGLAIPMREWRSQSIKFQMLLDTPRAAFQVDAVASLLGQVADARRHVEAVAPHLSSAAVRDSRFHDKIRSLTQLEKQLKTTHQLCKAAAKSAKAYG